MVEQNNAPAVNADDDDDDDNDAMVFFSLVWPGASEDSCLEIVVNVVVAVVSVWVGRVSQSTIVHLTVCLSQCPLPLCRCLSVWLSLLAAIDPFRIQIAIAGHANFNYTTDHLGRHGDEVTAHHSPVRASAASAAAVAPHHQRRPLCGTVCLSSLWLLVTCLIQS